MKIYDKEIYQRQQSIEVIIIIFIVFIIGFATGCIIDCLEPNETIENDEDVKQHILELEQLVEQQHVKIQEQANDIDSYKETIYILETYGK